MQTQRVAAVGDIAEMWALRTRAVQQTCASHYPADVVRIWSAAPPPVSYARLVAAGCAVVAEEDGKMLGFSVLNPEQAEVDAVFVDPAAGRRGIGGLLLCTLAKVALARGCNRLHLYASLNAVSFYAAFGFEQVREELYSHPCGIKLRCVYMQKRLDQGTVALVTP
jgi:putative acetyltransferase